MPRTKVTRRRQGIGFVDVFELCSPFTSASRFSSLSFVEGALFIRLISTGSMSLLSLSISKVADCVELCSPSAGLTFERPKVSKSLFRWQNSRDVRWLKIGCLRGCGGGVWCVAGSGSCQRSRAEAQKQKQQQKSKSKADSTLSLSKGRS